MRLNCSDDIGERVNFPEQIEVGGDRIDLTDAREKILDDESIYLVSSTAISSTSRSGYATRGTSSMPCFRR